MQSMNAEVRARARHRRRGRGLGIAAAIGAFAIFGTTAAVAAPAMRLLWQPDYVMTYQSELAGACTFSMLHEASVYDELGPVSYTHLDVYKRQGSRCSRRFSSSTS